jgi:uroporphyrinogen decarboxylase
VHQLLKENPSLLHNLLDTLAKSVSMHLNGQIAAGADVVMLFDTWGGMLDTNHYIEFSLNYIQQCIAELRRNYNNKKIPVILFTKGGHRWLEQMTASGCDVVGVDWEVSLNEARTRIGDKLTLQGNLNPACLLETPEVIRRQVLGILDSFGHGTGHVFNLGHGITPEVPPEHVEVLVNAVHELSKPYHAQQKNR